ncbi:DNA replication initiation control protein YabA, partial [Enterococcus faecium]
MDKRSLYDGLNQLESVLSNTLTELVEMKHALHE